MLRAMGAYRDRMTQKLTTAFAPHGLTIVDDSARHSGHAGDNPDGGGETHFKVAFESTKFAGKNRIDRQRMVYGVLADELRDHIESVDVNPFSVLADGRGGMVLDALVVLRSKSEAV